jgi:Flavodoxin
VLVTLASVSDTGAAGIVEANKECTSRKRYAMQAVVVYESMFGNTRQIADAIGMGLVDGCIVSVVPVPQASPDQIKDADLVVVGGPTHVHGMTRASTRQGAAKMAEEAGSGVVLEPDALAEGLRDWLDELGKSKVHAKAAAFDTRMPGPAALTGRASKGISRALRHRGYELVADPESFIVTKENTLEPGEEERARIWGAQLAALAAVGR